MANNFQIKLGGNIDLSSINKSIDKIQSKIKPLKLQVDLSHIQSQLSNLKINVGATSGKVSSAKGSLIPPTKSSTANAFTDKSAQILSKLTSQTINYESRLKSLKNSGALTKKEFDKFNNELLEVKKNLATGNIDKFKTDFQKLKNTTSETSSEMMTFGERTKSALSAMTQWMTATTIFFAVVRAIKDMVKQVINLDKQFTNLRIVTQKSDKQMRELKQTYIDTAQAMGVTLDTLVKGADEWLRAGLDIQETMDGIKASTILATVAQMDSATATQYLIAQMNAYNLEANQLITLVDKMSAVDIVAATSSQELGEAISLTAKSAQLAGIGYDSLIGMIAAVSETTRASASTIGNSFKTIFSRLQAVKIGSLVDPETGEDISDVDRLLKGYNIDLMAVTNNLENMGALLDLLGGKWDTYTTAQQSEIATTVAGVRQREKFLVLMSEYDRALELEKVSIESAGSAMEKYGIYQDSVEAKTNTLKTSITELYNTTLNSDIVKFVIDVLTGIIKLTNAVGGLGQILVTIGGIIIAFKAKEILSFFSSAITSTKTLFATIKTGVLSVQSALGIVGLAIAAISAVVGIVKGVKNSIEETERKLAEIRAEKIKKIEEEIATQEKLKAEYVALAYTESKTDKQKERLKELTKLLNLEYERELGNVDKLNGKYEVSADAYSAFIQSKIDKNKELLDSMKYDYGQAKKTLETVEQDALLSDIGFGRYRNFLSEDVQKNIVKIGSSYNAEGTKQERLALYKELEQHLLAKEDKTKADNKVLTKAHDQILELQAEIDSAKKSIEDYNATLQETEMYKTNKTALVELQQAMDKFNNSTLEEQTTQYENIDKMIDMLKKAAPQYIEMIDKMTEAYQNQAEALKKTDFALLALDKNLKALKELQKQEEEELKTKEKLLAVEKAREELAKAKDKRILAYRIGKGMTEVQDTSAIQEAQENLNKATEAVEGTKTEQAIKQVEELQAIYNKAQLLGNKVNGKTLRETFLDQSELDKFNQMTIAEKKAYLSKFLGGKSWEDIQAEDKAKLEADRDKYLPKYASGTTSASGGISMVGEKGAELRVLNKGDGVIDHNTTQNLMSLGKNPSKFIKSVINNGGGQTISIGNMNLPNVQNVQGFIAEIKNLASPRKLRTT